MDKGILNPGDVRKHPNVHVIRRYLGSPKTPQADTRLRLAKDESDTQARSHQGLRLIAGDLILLCTDGLTDVVEDTEIEAILRRRELQPAAKALVDTACSHKGKDNITVVLMQYPWETALEHKSRFWIWAIAGLAGLIVLASIIALAAWTIFNYVLPPSATSTPIV